MSDTDSSNGVRRRAWKTEFQSQLADSIDLSVKDRAELKQVEFPDPTESPNPLL